MLVQAILARSAGPWTALSLSLSLSLLTWRGGAWRCADPAAAHSRAWRGVAGRGGAAALGPKQDLMSLSRLVSAEEIPIKIVTFSLNAYSAG